MLWKRGETGRTWGADRLSATTKTHRFLEMGSSALRLGWFSLCQPPIRRWNLSSLPQYELNLVNVALGIVNAKQQSQPVTGNKISGVLRCSWHRSAKLTSSWWMQTSNRICMKTKQWACSYNGNKRPILGWESFEWASGRETKESTESMEIAKWLYKNESRQQVSHFRVQSQQCD